MAGKSGRSINNVPENPMKHIIFSWEGILVILFILVNIFCASFSEFYNMKSVLRQMPVYLAEVFMMFPMAYILVLGEIDISVGAIVCLSATLSCMVCNTNAPFIVVVLTALVVGALCGAVNGFILTRFKELPPMIVTLATQLIVYGILLMYIMLNGNNGQPLSGLDKSFKNFVTGSFLKIRGVPIPNYVWYACVVVVFMWFMWNKTTFGKNMFAVGSNPEAANVSGVNVMKTTIMVHTLAGMMYGITGFIESARIGSNTANTGLNYECDAIAACVIGGVSFVGGTGKISGVVMGVFLLRIIFVALNFLSINANLQYIIKGLIILVACAIDMRKYLVRK